jgi:hypothetical protein
MAQLKFDSMSFQVPSGEIKASLLGEDSPSSRLAVVVPGSGYSCKQPLLYYLIQVLLMSGSRVLTIDSLYADDKNWRLLPTEEEAYRYVKDDAESLFQQIQSRFRSIHTLVARSLGTYSVACALEKGLIHPTEVVWQCPSLHDKWSMLQTAQVRGLVIIGKSDPRYELARPFLSADSFIAENADHAMEVSDPLQSIDLLQQIIEYTRNWLVDSDVDMSQIERNLKLTPEQRVIEHQNALELCEVLARAGQRVHEQSQ